MDAGQIAAFLNLMRCRKASSSHEWVRATCPLGYRHSSGADAHPSFAVSIHPGDSSSYRCLACGASGSLLSLLWRLDADGRPVPKGAFEFLVKHNQINVDKLADEPAPEPSDFRGRVRASKEYKPTQPRVSNFVNPDDEPQASVPEAALQKMMADLLPRADVLDYLMREPDPDHDIKGRRLTMPTIKAWELGWHPVEKRICIPIRDVSGNLVAISGRLFVESQHSPKYLHSRFKRDRVLFGEHRHVEGLRRGYLFEGFFHVIYTWQEGYRNVLARMGTHLSRQQAERLIEWFDHLTIVPDGDKAGIESAARAKEMLEGQIKVVDIAPMPKGRDADNLPPDVLRGALGPPSV
jgi:hypothetical protein